MHCILWMGKLSELSTLTFLQSLKTCCRIFVVLKKYVVCLACMCDEMCFPSRITWWSVHFRMIYLQKVVGRQRRDKRKWISSQSQLIVGSPRGPFMRFSQCCDLPTCLTCLPTNPWRETAECYVLWTFMVLYLFRTRCLTGKKRFCWIPYACEADWCAAELAGFFCFCFFAAPSTVSIMHQVSRSVDSITLSWSQPDQPNGVILDYELQYYEKVDPSLSLRSDT